MRTRKGFTLIELMIVVVIIAILAALIVPLLLSRVEKAKRSEGKAIAGEIATAVRAYAAEYADNLSDSPTLEQLGFKQNELDAKYFQQEGSVVSGVNVTQYGQVSYIITVKSRNPTKLPDVILTCNGDNDYNPTFDDEVITP
jgi:prepilin-type N-terminal cleavage/methylation domain-containing protein